MLTDEEVFNLCKRIFRNDKTFAYSYERDKNDENKYGCLPERGKRWLTPSELVEDFVREHFPNRQHELFEEKASN